VPLQLHQERPRAKPALYKVETVKYVNATDLRKLDAQSKVLWIDSSTLLVPSLQVRCWRVRPTHSLRCTAPLL
jgi:hypothetical protein